MGETRAVGAQRRGLIFMYRTASIILLLTTFILVSATSFAEDLPLQVELSTGKTADFGTVSVSANSGDLVFAVHINPVVAGMHADLHRLYFNLHQPTTNLTIETLDTVSKPYSLRRGKPTLGGAGAFFDWSVDFGAGAGAKNGNGVLQNVSFRISGGDKELVVADILSMSVSKTGVSAQVATHLQEASLDGKSVSTVGGVLDPASTGSEDPGPGSEPSGDQIPAPDEGCTWVIDLFTGEPLYQLCG
jgi:hypothetical protein